MAKFHIGRNGKPAQCNAKKGNCPFGSEKEHYNSKQEAQNHLEEKLSHNQNVFSSAQKNDNTKQKNINYITSNLKEVSDIIKDKLYDPEKTQEQKEKEKQQKEEIFEILARTDKETIEKVTEHLFDEKVKQKYSKKEYETYQKFIDNVVNCDKNNTIFSRIDEIKNIENIDHIIDNHFKSYETYMPGHSIYKDVRKNGYEIKHAKELTSDVYYLNIENDNKEQKSYIMYTTGSKGLKSKANDVSMIYVKTDFEDTYIPYDAGLGGFSKKEKNNVLRYGLSMMANEYKNTTMSAKYRMFAFASLSQEETNFLKRAAIESAIHNKETYLQKRFSDIDIELSNDNTNHKNFQVGISKTKESQEEYAKSFLKNNPDVKKKINDLQSRKGYGRMQGTKSEKEKAKNTLLSMNENKTSKIVDYSGTSYGAYSSHAYGHTKRGSKVTDEDLDNMNSIIREVNEKSISRNRFLYRGASVPDGIDTQNYLEQFKPGDVFVNNRITSTSRSGKVADTFGNNSRRSGHIKFIYYTSKGAYIAPISRLSDEEEVLLPIGEKSVCIDKGYDKSGRAYVIFADAK